MACILALLIIQLAPPYYRQLTGMPAGISIFNNVYFWYCFALLFIGNSLPSGLYPPSHYRLQRQ